jgi:formylglycine-generating enzyme required for sulfatase activity
LNFDSDVMPSPNSIEIPLIEDASIGIALNRIPAGRFMMGARGHRANEEPVHEVCILYDFFLGKYPVTQLQFKVWTEFASIDHKNGFAGNDAHPAENMDLQVAVDFSRWLTKRYLFASRYHSDWPMGICL